MTESDDAREPRDARVASTPMGSNRLPSDAFSTLIEAATALCSTRHLRDLLVTMMERARDVMDAEASSVMLVDEPSGTLRWKVAVGDKVTALETLSVPIGEGIAGRVAASGQTLRIDDVQSDPRWDGRRFDAATGFTTRSMLCVPIRTPENRIIGVIQVLNRRGGPFSDDDDRLLQALAGMGGVAIENARLYEHLEEEVAERTAALRRTLAELREAQVQLVQSEKMAALGALVAGVAHEINTPLGSVMSNIDIVGRALAKIEAVATDPGRAEEAKRYLERATGIVEVSRDACRRIAEIVRSLRSFSRLDEAERQLADLHQGLDSTVMLIAHLVKNRITVRREYGSLPLVDCHPNQLNQVFLNLLVNATQAITGDGEIVIRTHASGGATPEAVIEITDSGSGISPEHLPRIFDPGFTTKGVGVGTGLGLSICYRIVHDHHGRIEVDSARGRGSTFRVVVPTVVMASHFA